MLITADWVLPVSRPPISHGAVLVIDDVIVEVGRADDLANLHSSVPRHDHPGCVIVPGLVNAHTHLSLTAIGGLIEPQAFEHWLSRLMGAIGSWEPGDHRASAALGAHRCLQAGVTVVGDITTCPEARLTSLEAGVGGTFFWEVLGIPSPALYARLEKMEFPANIDGGCGPRVRCGLSPHSPYTAGPRLIQALHEAALEWHVPYCVHAAESAAEVELLRDGCGPLADVAERNADGFEAPGCSPVTYLDRLGVLDGATVVHAGHIGPNDIARLASSARGVVACPRSNIYLSNPVAPVARLLKAGVPVGLGTDSAASNHDLDLMEDVRALHDLDPSISPRTLIEMVTAMGAITLGLEDRFGILERGMQADLAIFRIGETSDPESDFVRFAGASTVSAVLAAGAWKVLEGRLEDPVEPVEIAARAARVRAEHELERF